jgi:hypothetical protein
VVDITGLVGHLRIAQELGALVPRAIPRVRYSGLDLGRVATVCSVYSVYSVHTVHSAKQVVHEVKKSAIPHPGLGRTWQNTPI